MSESRYIVFPRANEVAVETEEVPDPAPGQVLCRARRSLVSTGTETYCLRGEFDPGTNWERWVQYPFRPGYSMAAEIIAVGAGVEGLEPGTRVTSWASHQELFLAAPHQLFAVPDGVSDDDATFMNLATTTQLAVRRAGHVLGETVGVVGVGLLGQLITQYLVLSGARTIVAIDTEQSRLELARAHGATHAVRGLAQDALAQVEELTGGRLLDVVYDVTGHPKALAQCIPLVRRLGRIVLVGDTPNPTAQHLAPGVVNRSIAILGIHGTMTPEHATEFNPWTRAEVTQLYFDYVLQGRMHVADLVTRHADPGDAASVYELLTSARGPEMGVLFDW
jgi:2-desacetyl-2-hydroxyethyl bacteriochlorophyllide A dehydrogenase